jgi:hypothetical protein
MFTTHHSTALGPLGDSLGTLWWKAKAVAVLANMRMTVPSNLPNDFGKNGCA